MMMNFFIFVLIVQGGQEVGAQAARSLTEQYWEHRQKVQQVLGNYRYYVYDDENIRKVTSNILHSQELDHEERAEVWIHRAALNGRRRTMDPGSAELFFVPLYLNLANKKYRMGSHDLIASVLQNISQGIWYQRYSGHDHVLSSGALNPGSAGALGCPIVTKFLPNSFRGSFEINPSWVGGVSDLNKLIAIPYVVKAEVFQQSQNSTDLQRGDISIFFAAQARLNAMRWSGCNRTKALQLETVKDALIHVIGVTRPTHQQHRTLIPHSQFAEHMHAADRCLFMCGDTPTSRRLFDSIVANCIPLIVGTRIQGLCERPCHPGWGWKVSGPDHPHLPFYDLYVDYSLFPVVNESLFYSDAIQAVAPFLTDKSHDRQLHEYLATIKDDVVYGYGSHLDSTHFGRVAENIFDTAIIRLRSSQSSSSLSPSLARSLRPSFHFSG